MQTESTEALNASHALEQYFGSSDYQGHAANVASLVQERLPNGEYAWLRPDNDRQYVLTDLARRELANDALFGPCPSVAEVARQRRNGSGT